MQFDLDPKFCSLLGRLQTFFAQKGCRGYLVGGFPRDLILGRPARDIDIAVKGNITAISHELAHELNAKPIPLDSDNDVVRLVFLGPKDNGWQIDLSAICDDLTADLKRRDFTINALALDLATASWDVPGAMDIALIDPLDGLADIKARVLRATGNEVFKQDAIRLLRAIRLASELGFTIDNVTEARISHDADLIRQEAGERVREELLRLLKLTGTNEVLFRMHKLNLVTAIFPELAPSVGLTQRNEHQWDVFEHSIHSVTALDFLLRHDDWPYTEATVLDDIPWNEFLTDHFRTPLSPISTRRELVKLAALLHDVAKPQTRTIAPNGRLRFYGHPQEGGVIVEKILERLRFSTKEKKLVSAVVRHHLRPVQICENGALPTKRATYRLVRDLGEATIDTLFFSLADHLATRGAKLDLTNWRYHANIVACVLSESARVADVTLKELLDGHDLQRELGLKPGVRMGEILGELREAQAAGEISSRDEAVRYAERLLS